MSGRTCKLFFLTLILRFASGVWDDDCDDLPSGWVRVNPGSKYVRKDPFERNYDHIREETHNEDIYFINQICLNHGFVLPSSTHRSDWWSLQRVAREMMAFRSPYQNETDFANTVFWVGDFHNNDVFVKNPNQNYTQTKVPGPKKGWVQNTPTQDPAFVIWWGNAYNSLNEPSQIRVEGFPNFGLAYADRVRWGIDRYDNSKVLGPVGVTTYYLAMSDQMGRHTVEHRTFKLCMFPHKSGCWTSSSEEKDNSNDDFRDGVEKVGETQNGTWWLTTFPKDFNGSMKGCQGTGTGLFLKEPFLELSGTWNFDLNGAIVFREIVNLADMTVEYAISTDIHPAVFMHAGKSSRDVPDYEYRRFKSLGGQDVIKATSIDQYDQGYIKTCFLSKEPLNEKGESKVEDPDFPCEWFGLCYEPDVMPGATAEEHCSKK